MTKGVHEPDLKHRTQLKMVSQSGQSFKAAKIEVGINANQYSQVAKKYKSHKGLHSRI